MKKDNFIVEKIGRYHFSQVIKVNTKSKEIQGNMYHLIEYNEKNRTSKLCLPKMYNLKLIMRKPKLRDICNLTGLIVFKCDKVMKIKERLELFKIKET